MWNSITSGFDVEDETANFGTRAVAESEVAVFETNTLATIQAENRDELSSIPAVYAEYYLELGCCLVIDNSVALFNENCSQTLLSLTFDTKIDTVRIIGSGKFIFIGLDNGELHFYHISSKTVIFTRSFSPKLNSLKTFVKIEFRGDGESLEIFIITTMEKLYRITNLKLDTLETACENKDSVSVEKLGQGIVVNEMFGDSAFNFKVTSGCGLDVDDTYSFLLVGKDLYFMPGDDIVHKTCPLHEEFKLRKIELTQNKSLCFGLTETGKLVVLCMHTLMPIFVWDDLHVVDFTLLDGLDAENNILIITGGEIHNMLLMSWPGFQVKFKLQVQPFSYLVYQQSGSEDILYVEGFGEEKINTIRLKAIVESQPEFRLQRILRKGRFEEAEKFARTFNLNIELVYRAQIQRLMQDLQPWNNTPESVRLAFVKFMALLEKITDIEFVSECCINAIPPDFKATQMLLEYGRIRLSKLPEKSESYIRSDLLQKISSISQRLSTFQQIHGSSANSDSWLHFLKADLFKECQKHLKRGEIRESVFIWSRHLYEIKAKINWNQILLLLEENIPTWVKAKDIALWLRQFVPPILAVHPDIPQYILQWTIGKIKTLEVSERESWPDVGLDLAFNVLRILEVSFSVHDPLLALQENTLCNNQCTPKSPFNRLLAFIKNLQDMQTLKNNYGVVISCIDFLQLSDQELMIVILERTPIEKIKLLMKDFLKKMILERNLVSDIVISNFIKEFVNSSVDWSQWDEAPWERMVAALIPCIHGIQERLESVLHVLDVAPVPWTSVIKCIAEDALKLKHPLTNAVQECVNIIPQKLILKKYGFKKDLLLGKKSVTVIKRILLLDQESALQDVLKIAESITDKCFSHQIILKYLIEKDNYQAALEVLAGLDSEVASACKDYILNLARQYLKINSMEKVGHYIKILPLICTDAEWFPAKKCYSLKMDKKVDCSPQDFCYKSAKSKRLSDHTTVILKGLLEKQLTEEEVVSKISRYVHLLDISYEEWIVSIATQAVHCQFSLAYSLSSNIKHLNHLSDDEHTKVLTLAVSLLAYYRTEADMSTVEDLVKLICKLATQSVIHCSSDYVDKALDMLIWFGLLKSASGTHRNVFNDIYTDPAPSSPTIISLHFHVQNMLLQYIKSAPSNNRSIKLDSRVLEAFEGASENNLLKENIVSKFPTIFRRLRDEQQNITGICLLISFSWSLWSLDVFEAGDIENILNLSIIDLLKKLTNSRHFDLPLALGLLNYFEENEALLKLSEIEKSVALNYQKLSSLSLLGLTYCNMYKIESYWKHFTKKRAQCTWAKKLSELGISYKEAFKESDHDQKQLLLKLMKTPGVTLALLEEYCTSMRVYFQDCLEIYLEEILLSWEPDIEFKTNNSGKKDLLVKHSSDDLKKRCLAIIDMTNSETKQQIETTLQSLWNKINYYYYEVFIVIIELVEERLTKCRTDDFNRYKLLLGFLSNYIRISEAQSDEKENWFQIRPSTQNLPPIAEFRLPFTLLLEGDPWKIIKPELNLTTYKMWFYVISILRLDKNTLCSLTIHRLTSNHLSAGDSTEDPSGWCVHLKNRALLADIKECVGNITNLEMASASLYYVVSHMPPGADQVAAAEMCYIEAQKWVNLENSEKAEKGLAKVEKKYLTVSTSHILHSHQLGEQKYLQLVLLPDELIYELYHDPSILKRKSGCTNHLPDINRAVGAIATLNTLNITKIRLDILTDWLQAGNMNLDTSVDDTTCNITVAMFNHRFDPASTVENENLIRACYLLESTDEIKTATYLSAFAFGNDDGESRNILVKLRALQCLCAVTSNNITKQVTGRDLAEIRRHMQQLLFIYELEKLGLAWSADKSEIVRILLKRTNPQAVSIAAAICREFNLNIPEFWDSILARMVAIEMIEALCLVLPDLTPYSHLLNSEVFKNGWNFVILTPLSKAVYPMNEEETRKVENSIEMLHKCPIPFEIDFATINKHCQRLHAEDLLIQLGHL